MNRIPLAALLLLFAPALAPAQGIVSPYKPPVIPRNSPAAIPPGVPFVVGPPAVHLPYRPPGFGLLPVVNYLPGLWPAYGYYGYYGYGWNLPPAPPVVVAPPAPPPPLPTTTNPTAVRDNMILAKAEVPATLILQLPAPADVWLDGEKVGGPPAATRELASPPLRLGTEYTFRVKARWTLSGTDYEVERTSAIPAGSSKKLIVVSGRPVK